MIEPLDRALRKAASLLRNASYAVAFTGAGISTPSGIPDFRSHGTGLWERDDPMEVASLGVFQAHPERFFGWLRPLLQGTWDAQPNAAHLALARLEAAGFLKAVITQNIDNLHQRAGSSSVYEVHGSLRSMTCTRCHETYRSDQFLDQLKSASQDKDGLPRCPSCKAVLKPDIVLFGEMLPADTWSESEEHCKQADLILVAGSSLEVWPAAALPELAVEQGAHLIINNLTPTPMDRSAEAILRADVAEVLPKLADLVL